MLDKLSFIEPSETPLKAYELPRPNCDDGGEVFLPADNPDTPWCRGCDEEIDLEALASYISSWLQYLKDRTAYLEQKEKD